MQAVLCGCREAVNGAAGSLAMVMVQWLVGPLRVETRCGQMNPWCSKFSSCHLTRAGIASRECGPCLLCGAGWDLHYLLRGPFRDLLAGQVAWPPAISA